MFDRDKRRVVRQTTDPVEVKLRLQSLALASGMSFEAYGAMLLEEGVNAKWSLLGLDERSSYFPPIDCMCCRPGAYQVADPV